MSEKKDFAFCDIPLFDAHCHIGGEERPGRVAGGRLLCGAGVEDWEMIHSAAASWAGTVAAYGVHPWRVGELAADGAWLKELEEFLTLDAGAWVGEIGLDGMRTHEAEAGVQEKAFRRQLRAAARWGRRVNLHCVRAWDAFVKILDEEYGTGTEGREFIVHSFAGPFQYINALAGRGAYFSVGPLAWRHGSRSRTMEERARLLPLARILVESDAFLAPGADAVEDLEKTVEWLAGVRGMDRAELAGVVRENVGRLFGDG